MKPYFPEYDPPNGKFGCSWSANWVSGAAIAALVKDQGPLVQALRFRAWLTNTCSGNFNVLFSGDG